MTNFVVSPEFQIATKRFRNRLTLGKKPGSGFWQQNGAEEYKNKRGCYIFAIKHGNKITATYIGKATETFKQEIFTKHKIEEHYKPALRERQRGQAIMIFLEHKYVKKPNKSSIDELETRLIQQAVRKDLALTNLRKTYMKELKIKGVYDFKVGKKPQGRSNGNEAAVKKMLKF